MKRRSVSFKPTKSCDFEKEKYPFLAKAILSFKGVKERKDVLSFERGEKLCIISDYISGWQIAQKNHKHYYVPSKYILKLEVKKKFFLMFFFTR